MQTISDDPDLEIRMTSGHNCENPQLVSCVKVSEGKCTLDLHLAPIGNDKTEYDYCLDKATKTHSHLLCAPLDCKKTQIGFMLMILSKFSWPLGTMCFSENNA